MPDIDLDLIERRANVATPGPWWDDEGAIAYERRPGDKRYVACDHEHHGCCSAEDAEFIAHAREDVPALVAEVRRLRSEVGHG